MISFSSKRLVRETEGEPVARDNEHPESLSQVSGHHVHDLGLTAVRVEEDQFLYPRAIHGLADVRPHRLERRGAQRHGAGEIVVLDRFSVGHGRHPQDPDLVGEEIHGARQDAGVDGSVDAHGEMRSVLLDGANGEYRNAARGVHRLEVRGRHVRPLALREAFLTRGGIARRVRRGRAGHVWGASRRAQSVRSS